MMIKKPNRRSSNCTFLYAKQKVPSRECHFHLILLYYACSADIIGILNNKKVEHPNYRYIDT